MSPASDQRRLAERTAVLLAVERQGGRVASVRLLVFLLAAWALWAVLTGRAPWQLLGIPFVLFLVLIAIHGRLERRAERAKRSIRFYQRGLGRLRGTWQGTGETGERFIDPHHPYAVDLDLFGRGSLFELISTARTKGGEARLAQWFLQGASAETIVARHAAVAELRGLVDWREELSILGDDYRRAVNPDALSAWATAAPSPFHSASRTLAFGLSLIAFGVLAWWVSTAFVGVEPRLAMLPVGIAEGLFFWAYRHRIAAIANGIDEPAADLDLLSKLLASVEAQSFEAPLLKATWAKLEIAGHPASQRIARLRRWKELLDSTDNVVLRIVGPLLLWTTQIAMALENWRSENGRFIPGWLDALSEIEALSSLAGYAYENPTDPFPRMVSEGPHFEAVKACHPLLPRDRAVGNSIDLSTPTRLYIVSGSNMSGKSTLLRTLGTNAVLALAGAPVRAEQLTLSALSIGASIRTTDSLEEGHSRFMAEILRLKQVLELPAPVLFLLDELLHGTNSHDRSIGSEGLVRALLDRGAIGLVTTHDLSLSRVAEQLNPTARNVHFEDRLEGGRLIFDYTMRDGVVTRSNALDLMRAVGLNV